MGWIALFLSLWVISGFVKKFPFLVKISFIYYQGIIGSVLLLMIRIIKLACLSVFG
jgi:hypothetical protein